jgi:hypothetical protein
MDEEGVASISDQQVGVVWPAGRSDGLAVSVELEGNLNCLVEGSQKPTRVVRGHQKNITAVGISGSTFATGSYEGLVLACDLSTGHADKVEGAAHSNYVTETARTKSTSEAELYSVSWDDTLRSISVPNRIFIGQASELGSHPKGVSATTSVVLVLTSGAINVYQDGSIQSPLLVRYAPTAIAAYGLTVAIGETIS